LIVVDKSSLKITNFFGSRLVFKELNDKIDQQMLEYLMMNSIYYIANIHNKNMFHGDIKPVNLFYHD
jgi:tRNA A-37 threonylcarbamoyl transferase component Bud32